MPRPGTPACPAARNKAFTTGRCRFSLLYTMVFIAYSAIFPLTRKSAAAVCAAALFLYKGMALCYNILEYIVVKYALRTLPPQEKRMPV